MRRVHGVLFFFAMFACLSWSQARAQEDPLAEAKVYPTYSNAARASRAIDSIEWQLGIKLELARRFAIHKEELMVRVDASRNMLRKLTEELPAEFQFVDANVRSQLIGKAMGELLNAKLDLATRESSLAQLEKMLMVEKDSKQAKLLQRQGKMEVEGAMLKAKLAESKFEKSKKLADKGYTTENEKLMAQYDLALARQELESVVLKVDVEVDFQNAEVAQRLTAARVEVEPVKARIAAIEQFLKAFRDSAQISLQIEEIQREAERLEQNMRELDSAVFHLKQEIEELSVLKSRIDADLKKETPPREGGES